MAMSRERAARILAMYREQMLSQRERANPITLNQVREAKEVLGIGVAQVLPGKAPATAA